VNIALVATTITLTIAVALYMILPHLHLAKILKPEIHHQRQFISTPAGGEIHYQGPDSARLKEDLEILSRRFQRGQFDMVVLPGSKLSPQVVAIKQYAKSYVYAVEAESSGAVLKISGGPAGPLQDYLKYLEANWH